jgi:hypothetical protein
VGETFSGRHQLADDFRGDTHARAHGRSHRLPLDSETHRLLFTGDTIDLNKGEWIAARLESSDRAAYIENLDLIRELDFDVLVPWPQREDSPTTR